MSDQFTALTARFGAEPVAIARRLLAAGHDAVIVGGPVRDALLGGQPHDVDLATSATPTQVRALFPRTYVQGSGERHGTIGVLGDSGETYEVTTYRIDLVTDGRHVTEMAFTTDLREDLLRRDFTINAIAVRPDPAADTGVLIDPYGGRADLAAGVIRAVGDPAARFREDRLRILRAYRFAARYGFAIDPATQVAMREAMPALDEVSRERVADEFQKLFSQTTVPGRLATGLRTMLEDGALANLLPEVAACAGVTQNEHHAYDVFTHLAAACDAAGPSDWRRRWVLLLHDIGKPATRSVAEDGRVHFYGHEDVGATLAGPICERLRMKLTDRAWIVEGVRQHMRLLQMNEGMSPRALRRIARDLTADVTLEDLLEIRRADKLGSGVDRNHVDPVREAEVRAMIDELRASQAAVTTRALAVNGHDLMQHLAMRPGPTLGRLLEHLLDRVVDEPALNTREALLALAGAWVPPVEAVRVPAARRAR